MSAPVRFDLSAAEAAEEREANGADLLPGDQELIADLDGWRGHEYERYWAPIWAADAAEQNRLWLTRQCPGCETGGTGEPCDEHAGDWCYCGRAATGRECVSCHNMIELVVARSADV